MDALAALLITWIATKTGLEAPAPPKIVLIPQHEIAEMYLSAQDPRALRLRGLYDRKTMTIYLPATWNQASLRDKSDLLHELVHHMQRTNNLAATCEATREGLAFDLQVKWLREQGVKEPHEFIDTNDLTISLLSRCEWEY